MCIGLNRKLMVQYGAGIINFVYKIFTYTKYAFDNWNQHEKKKRLWGIVKRGHTCKLFGC